MKYEIIKKIAEVLENYIDDDFDMVDVECHHSKTIHNVKGDSLLVFSLSKKLKRKYKRCENIEVKINIPTFDKEKDAEEMLTEKTDKIYIKRLTDFILKEEKELREKKKPFINVQGRIYNSY
jgi:molybdopterin synthase catalytic subunit